MVHSHRDDQREDLITLLGLLTDPRVAAEDLTSRERTWLRKADPLLDLGNGDLDAVFDPVRLRVARAAWQRLLTDKNTVTQG